MSKVILSWSSGKDSAWTLHVMRTRMGFEPSALLTTITQPYDRVSMHGIRTSVLHAQAEAAGLPLVLVGLPVPCTNEIYETRMGEAVRSLVDDGFTHVAFGDLFLEDVRRYREDRLHGLGLEPIFPLWGSCTAHLAREMIESGVEAWLTCVDLRSLPREFAGRRYDDELLRTLPSHVDPCGENGEFHTCVTAGPMFHFPLHARSGETVERDGFAFGDLTLISK